MRKPTDIRRLLKVHRARVIDSGDDGMAVDFPIGSLLLKIVCSWGAGWDHVSVSLPHRCPTWEEMVIIKEVFWPPGEWAVQYHTSRRRKVNVHPFCLHMWRPQDEDIPTPPIGMV